MNIKTIKDALELRQGFMEKLERSIEMHSTGDGPIENLLRELGAALERTKTSLEAAIEEREETVKLADQRVQRKKDELARLEQSFKELSQRQKPSSGTKGPKKKATTKKK